MELRSSSRYVLKLQSMRKPVVVINDPILERCFRKDSQIVDYFEQVTQPTLLTPVRKSRDLTLYIPYLCKLPMLYTV